MGSKNITISDKAYEYLKKLKKQGKSFSDIILEFKEKRQDVMSYAGSLKSSDLDSIEKIRENSREDWKKRK